MIRIAFFLKKIIMFSSVSRDNNSQQSNSCQNLNPQLASADSQCTAAIWPVVKSADICSADILPIITTKTKSNPNLRNYCSEVNKSRNSVLDCSS